MTANDLRPVPRSDLKWDTEHAEASLNSLFEQAEQHGVRAINWYLNAKRPKKLIAQGLRLGAIGAAAIAGILPMLSQILVTSSDQLLLFQPVWASIALGVAALLVAIDHFFGFSSGWMRFITTEHQIRQILHEFQLDYDIERATWQGKPPTPEQVQSVLQRCKSFLIQVDEIIRQETEQWVTEFQSALKRIDEAAMAKAVLSAHKK
jgi:hypothetical protein